MQQTIPMTDTLPGNLQKAVVAAFVLMISLKAIADTADNILRYSESQLLRAGQTMAEGVARSSPSQIDSTTVLLGAIFARDTKTFIYKYESSIRLDPSRMAQAIPRYTCADRIRRALMSKGITFKHVYITPAGQLERSVTIRDCS
jgi:hypothetical protein